MAAAAAANTGHSHRAGKLKQQNKKNKRTVSSKRSLNRRKGAGKVQSGTAVIASSASAPSSRGGGRGTKNSSGIVTSSQENKANRLNAIKQRRDASKKNVWNARRFLLMPAATTADAMTADAATNNSNSSSNGNHNIIIASLQRAMSSASDPPRIVGIISLSDTENSLEETVRSALMESADQLVLSIPTAVSNGVNDDGVVSNKRSIVTASYSASSFARTTTTSGTAGGGKQNHQQLQQLTLLTNSTAFTPQYLHMGYQEGEDASIQGALDLCRVCDLVLFLIDGNICNDVSIAPNPVLGDAATTTTTGAITQQASALDDLISVRGERILTAIKAQGLPTPVTVVVHTTTSPTASTSTATGVEKGEMDNDASDEEDDDIMMDDYDDDDKNEEKEMVDYLPSSKIRARSYSNAHSYSSHRSIKSIRRSYLRKRAEVKRYAMRFAATEFGESGNKVVEIDIVMTSDASDGGTGSGATIEEDSASTIAAAVFAKSSHEMKLSVSALIRILCTISASGPSWVADASRPYLVTDGCIDTIINSTNNTMAAPLPVQYDAASQELKLTGYIRGNTLWNVNRPVHVPHLGTYSVKDVRLAGVHAEEGQNKILVLPPIVAAGRKHRKKGNINITKADKAENTVQTVNVEEGLKNGPSGSDACAYGSSLLLAESNAEARESLEMFASPDSLEGEQNLIGFDEGHDIDDDPSYEGGDGQGGGVEGGQGSNNTKQFQPGTSRPAGWSDYQSAWLDALDGEGEETGDDHGELAFSLNNKSCNKTSNKYSSTDTLMGDDDDDGGDGTEINAEAKRAFVAQRKKDATVDLQFPDEVDYEEETSARDRYARYRALKSFRKSYWDPKENLPTSYGAIYHFASFKATQRDVLEDARELEEVVKRRGWGVIGRSGGDENDGMDMSEERDLDEEDDEEKDETMMTRACVPPGAYVTITLENVSPTAIANLSSRTLVSAVSLLPHENKVSVLHMGLAHSSKSEHDAETLPVKSKDVLTFRCGWRTWQSRPIFSQHNLNSDKHKFERFMPTGGGGSGSGTYFAGSMFGPVSYAPCPVIMFRETRVRVGGHQQDGTSTSEGICRGIKRELLAHGSILGADADRIVLKRIVLTGYPTRVHKRHATVKYMFYNPEDVKWFMPAGITTKHGLQGHIVQSVGDHGVMKCLFNAPIKQHDTVCLPLYKRIFPKFAPVSSSKKRKLRMSSGEDASIATAGDGGLMKDFRVL